jgi:hypothetical protein
VGVPAVLGLDASEQLVYERATAALNAGRAGEARSLAKPLFATHGNLPAVQELRCKTAMAIGADPSTLDAECAGVATF